MFRVTFSASVPQVMAGSSPSGGRHRRTRSVPALAPLAVAGPLPACSPEDAGAPGPQAATTSPTGARARSHLRLIPTTPETPGTPPARALRIACLTLLLHFPS